MDHVNEFFARTTNMYRRGGYWFQQIRPRIVCCDGYSLSVQASEHHYCLPRVNAISEYWEVEVGFPSARPPDSWGDYFDGEWQRPGFIGSLKRMWAERGAIWFIIKDRAPWSKPQRHSLSCLLWSLSRHIYLHDNSTMGVYGYIPTIMVNELIDAHGGIDYDKSLADWVPEPQEPEPKEGPIVSAGEVA